MLEGAMLMAFNTGITIILSNLLDFENISTTNTVPFRWPRHQLLHFID